MSLNERAASHRRLISPVNNRYRIYSMDKPRTINSIFVNPYLLNGIVWLFVVLVYQLGWSRLCPPLSFGMQVFMTVSIVVSLALGVYTYHKERLTFRPLKSVSFRHILILCIILWILFAIDCVGSGDIPLLGYLRGNITVSYKEFGVPVLHVVLVNGLSCLVIYCYYAYRSVADKALKRKLMCAILTSYVPFALMFNRGAILSIMLGMFLIWLFSAKRPFRALGIITLSSIGILFAFGMLGNMRMGKNLNDIILKIGKATDDFKKSSIPDEFFWGYLYIATPLANVQNTIDHTTKTMIDTKDLEDMVMYEFTPDIITKRIRGEKDKAYKSHRSNLLTDNLNATSVYGRVFKYMGWSGLWTMFGFILLFIFINMRIVPKDSSWFLPVLITIDEIVVMNLFDNMFIFAGMIPQLLIFVMIYCWVKFMHRPA